MVIMETKEQLVKQLDAAWSIIARADEALDTALHAIQAAHKNLRQFSQEQQTHDNTTAVHRREGMESASNVGTRKTVEAKFLSGLSAAKQKYTLRAGRDTSKRGSVSTDAESGC